MLCSIVGNLKIVSLAKFKLIWTMESVSRMLLICPNFSLALWPRPKQIQQTASLFQGWLTYRTILHLVPSMLVIGES